ncbi:MAG: SsrA-binding protein SmpB [Pseudomonadota bacterium]
MSGPPKSSKEKASACYKIIAENRKARFNYFVEDVIEVGIVLKGTEVKSLREGKGNIAESYANVENGELWLINSHILEYSKGNRFNHEPKRMRKLLATRKEINKCQGFVQRSGLALVPLKIYFNHKGYVKVTLGICKGKQNHDKRETEKQRDWNKQKSRILKNNI